MRVADVVAQVLVERFVTTREGWRLLHECEDLFLRRRRRCFYHTGTFTVIDQSWVDTVRVTFYCFSRYGFILDLVQFNQFFFRFYFFIFLDHRRRELHRWLHWRRWSRWRRRRRWRFRIIR